MASNGYNGYNYQGYPQSSAPQYSGYQTTPATNTTQQNARQYQQPAPAATSQSTDYSMPTYSTQTYGNQSSNTFGRTQDTTWTGTNYGGNRETTRGAAEVLRNMSNTPYGSSATPAAAQSGFTSANAATAAAARYSTSSPAQHQTLAQPQQTHSSHTYSQIPQQSHTQAQAHAHPQAHSQAQSQPRPRSVNASRNQNTATNRGITSPAMAAGYPSQRTQNVYNQQAQRSESPAQLQSTQLQYSSTAAPVNSAQPAQRATATQYSDYNRRQLPNVDAARNTPNSVVSSTSYSYTDNRGGTPAPIAQPAGSAPVVEQYNQSAVTVDPMAVYNPYAEYEKKQEKLRQEREVREEEERKAEELRLEEERRKEEERKKAEDEERARQAALQPPEQLAGSSEEPAGTPLEAEIRAMMAKMRELNSKDPALLARIWEEERRAKAPKSPTAQSKATPQPATAPPAASMVQKAPAQRKKPGPKAAPSAIPPRPQPVPTPPVQAQAARSRPPIQQTSGNTIWPTEKKAQIATAATTYLNSMNPNNTIARETFLGMLDGNPSYVQVCEALEARSMRLERGAFARSLMAAVPDVNDASRAEAQAQGKGQGQAHARTPTQLLNIPTAQRFQVPPAATATNGTMNAIPTPHYAPAQPAMTGGSYPPFPGTNKAPDSQSPVPVAQMIPIKPEMKPPANKEEAARKRTFEDLIDLTTLSEDDMEPMAKKQNVGSMYSYDSPGPAYDDEFEAPTTNNFPVAPVAPTLPPQQTVTPTPIPLPNNELKARNVVQPLDKKKALRRNTYNISTIARDVLLACGRHPDERQLNQHLEVLKATLPQITNESDLSTLRWDIIDPGNPPKGYYRDASQGLAEDADDEEDSDDEEEERKARARASSQANGAGATLASAQPLPAPTNPFKTKKRGPGRPPAERQSLPANFNKPTAPATPRVSSGANMSASASRPAAGSVGYSAFRAATEYGPDGKPLPKKRGRPVGWRKAIHGSPAAQAHPSANGYTGPLANRYTPSQPSTLRNVRTGDQDAIMIRSDSPNVPAKAPKYQSFKCRWQNCKADLHNLDTLKKHVHKVHCKETLRGQLECLWGDCGKEVTSVNPTTSMRIEKHGPFSFQQETYWREHLELRHFGPLSWELGDGPASGLSDAQDTDHYLSDAQGRRVTPRVSVDPSRHAGSSPAGAAPTPRGRGRPPKALKEQREQEAREAQSLLVAQKKRLGGPGIDRGGATLVTDKRRKGFSDDDQTEEEFVPAEDWVGRQDNTSARTKGDILIHKRIEVGGGRRAGNWVARMNHESDTD